MITADALLARAVKMDAGPAFLAGEASQIAFEITAHPAMPEHVARTQAQGVVFEQIFKALHRLDANAAQTVVEQVFPGFAVSTVARCEADGAGIMPDDSDELRRDEVFQFYPPEIWSDPDGLHLDVRLPRHNRDILACRVSIAIIAAVLYGLELQHAQAASGEAARNGRTCS